MQKSLIHLAGLVICSAIISSAAIANTTKKPGTHKHKYYVRAGVGFPVYRHVSAPQFHKHPKFGILGDLAVGFKINPKFTFELEGLYLSLPSTRTNATVSSKMRFTSLAGFGNVYYNFPKKCKDKLRISLGIGVGVARNKTSDLVSTKGRTLSYKGNLETQVTYQGIIAASYKLNKHWDFVLDARYICWNKFSNFYPTKDKLFGSLGTVVITTGAKYKF